MGKYGKVYRGRFVFAVVGLACMFIWQYGNNSFSPKPLFPETFLTHLKHRSSRDDLSLPPNDLVSLKNLPQEDNSLIEYIRKSWILSPSNTNQSQNPRRGVHYSQIGQSRIVDEFLGGRRSGFYVECGAAEGKKLSNSLFFEETRDWKGLLVEADPGAFQELLKLHRNAYLLNACLSPSPQSTKLNFTTAGVLGGLERFMESTHKKWIMRVQQLKQPLTVQCFPLFSVLSALGVDHVDYFSLDVEGAELDILKTIPFDRITFDVMTVEYHVAACPKCSLSKLKELDQLLTRTGLYSLNRTIANLDAMFVRKALL